MGFFNFRGMEKFSNGMNPDVTAADHKARAIKIVVLCFFWYAFSALSNNISKSLLRIFPFPQTLTAVQLGSVLFYLPIQMKMFGIKYQPLSRSQFVKKISPLAIMRIFAMIMSAVSILKVPVSYAHTVKAISPVSTVVMSMLLLREYPTLPIIVSLLPIVAGIMLATVTEVSFDLIGMICALVSTVLFSVQNIYSKKIMRQRILDHMNLLYHSTRAAFMIFFPFWLLTDGWTIAAPGDAQWLKKEDFSWFSVVVRLLLEGVCFFGQNITAFSVLFLVSPVSYSVANTTKRIVVISASLIVFGNKVSFWNVVGMSMAIGGVGLYNKAKYEAARQKSDMVLPQTKTDTVSSEISPFMEYGDKSLLEVAEKRFSIAK